ncbi:MAG: hypothetical protein ABSF36_01540 [Candidatus Methanomethylicaceae archaeon]|jgi:hypothetical protein
MILAKYFAGELVRGETRGDQNIVVEERDTKPASELGNPIQRLPLCYDGFPAKWQVDDSF